MARYPVFIEGGQKARGQPTTPATSEQPPPEQAALVGDSTWLQEKPSSDDKPLP